MRESKITVSKAMKLYTGTGLAKTILGLTAFELAFFIGASVTMAIMIMFSEGITYFETAKSIAETPAVDGVMALPPSIISFIALLSQYDKDKPGGKLFRTVKGGFGTFVGYRTGAYISILLSTVIYGGAVFVLSLFGVLGLHGGASAALAVIVSSIAAVGVVSFTLFIKNEGIRALISGTAAMAITVGCTLLLPHLTDSLIPHLIIGIIGVGLVIVSMRVYFSYYKKHIWN